MAKVKSLADLKKMSSEFKSRVALREKGDNIDNLVQVKVGMGTCGIAAGAKDIMDFFINQFDEEGIDGVVLQTGCLGHCEAEPLAEVSVPGKAPLVFGNVTPQRAGEILNKYIKKGEAVEGIIPVNHEVTDK